MQESDKLRIESHYLCVPWLKDLAYKIADGGPQYLIDRVKSVDWSTESSQILNYGDEGIDPFSFFYVLASKNTSDNKFKTVYRSVYQTFELNASDITNFPDARVFPTPIPIAKLLFHDGVNFNQRLLWNLFRQAATSEPIVLEDYREVLGIKFVDVRKLTQCLFLINPDRFHPIDDSKNVIFGEGRIREWIREIRNYGYKAYEDAAVEINSRFPGCKPYEINLFNFLQAQSELVRSESCIFQIGAHAFADGVDVWDHAHDEQDTPSFSEGSCVYTGGPNSAGERPYEGLSSPKRGDIVLVRNGLKQGNGIGVVFENEYKESETYPNGWDPNKAIRVIWINKSPSNFNRQAARVGFSQIDKDQETYRAFEEAYPSTFKMIDSIVKDVNPPPIKGKNLNTILYGPPGTGKTYATFRKCVEICDGEVNDLEDATIKERYKLLVKEQRIEFITFHQSYSYEEFVEGLRPESSQGSGFNLNPKDGVLKRIANRACQNSDEEYVLVIDEINRANVSKVLGELITLLEEDKRRNRKNEISVTLPYSGDSFTLPNNLHILGTMNTADRSIALLDTALRRRFAFEEISPAPELLKEIGDKTGIDLPKVLEKINQRLEWFADRDHKIGHAWFMGNEIETKEQIDKIMRDKVIPLIAEYFYEDWKKVQSVLGGGEQFVLRERLQRPPGDFEGPEDERFSWSVRPEFAEDAYDHLIGGQDATAQEVAE